MLDKPAYAIALKLAKTLFYGKFMLFFSDELPVIGLATMAFTAKRALEFNPSVIFLISEVDVSNV